MTRTHEKTQYGLNSSIKKKHAGRYPENTGAKRGQAWGTAVGELIALGVVKVSAVMQVKKEEGHRAIGVGVKRRKRGEGANMKQ